MQVCIHQQHMQCVYHAYVLVCFSQCATLSPNGPHGIVVVQKGEWEERTNCPVAFQSASRQGCPALQPAINLSLSITISPFVCLPFASLILANKVFHTCNPKDSFSIKPRMPMVLHDPSDSVHLPWISNLPVAALHDPCADKINASAFLMPFLHAVPTCSA